MNHIINYSYFAGALEAELKFLTMDLVSNGHLTAKQGALVHQRIETLVEDTKHKARDHQARIKLDEDEMEDIAF